jgi:hypothetical protein
MADSPGRQIADMIQVHTGLQQHDEGFTGALTSLTDVDFTTPANGDVLRYNSVSGQWETNPTISTFSTFKYTSFNGQTTFEAGNTDTGAVLSYSPGSILVTMNGIVLEDGTDYTASTGNTIVLATGANADDELNVYAFNTAELSDVVPASTGGTFAGGVSFTDAAGITVSSNSTFSDELNVSDNLNVTNDVSLGGSLNIDDGLGAPAIIMSANSIIWSDGSFPTQGGPGVRARYIVSAQSQHGATGSAFDLTMGDAQENPALIVRFAPKKDDSVILLRANGNAYVSQGYGYATFLRATSTTLDGFSGEALNVADLMRAGDGTSTSIEVSRWNNLTHYHTEYLQAIDVPNTTDFLRYSITLYENSSGTAYFPVDSVATFEVIEMDPSVLRYNIYETNTDHATALNGAGVGPYGAV